MFNHLSAVSESIPALGWITVVSFEFYVFLFFKKKYPYFCPANVKFKLRLLPLPMFQNLHGYILKCKEVLAFDFTSSHSLSFSTLSSFT